ncbi:transcriptional activator of ethanol catabolism AlcS [Trichoderma velutinum]
MSADTRSKYDQTIIGQMPALQPSQSVTMSTELFEKLYLNPSNKVPGDFRRRFANPTPLALIGFLIASGPLGAALMGWRGSGGDGAATVGAFYFFGGLLQIIGSLLEWIIGNAFIYVVFGSFGAFWLAFAATLTPYYNAEGAFTSSAITPAEKEAGIRSFEASLAFLLLFMGILVFVYLICSLQTNMVFFAVFFFLDTALFLLTGAYWKAAQGDEGKSHHLKVASGAFVFVFCAFGWYLLIAQLFLTVGFPLNLPVGDLNNRIIVTPKSRDMNTMDQSV